MKKILLIASVAMFASACSQEQAAQTAKEQAQKRVEAAKQYQSKFSIDKKEKD